MGNATLPVHCSWISEPSRRWKGGTTMKALRFVIASLLLSMLAGCFDVETVVRVRPDGSGVVDVFDLLLDLEVWFTG